MPRPPSFPDPYSRETFRGVLLDVATITALQAVEVELGYQLTLLQGIGGAAASAGTHLDGRAVDLAEYDYERKVRVLRDHGFAAWHREALPGVWGPHIHAVLILNTRANTRGIAPSGFAQIADYDHGGVNGAPGDGLAGIGTDPNRYRPAPPRVSVYPPKVIHVPPTPTLVQQARTKMVEAVQALRDAEALLDSAEGRKVAQGQRDEIKAARASVRKSLDVMPKK